MNTPGTSTANPVLVVIGPPGAGKSIVGKLTARLLKVPFIDVDRRIVKEHGSIPKIFAKQGEPKFREFERIHVAKALSEPGVVALGGGAVLNADTQRDLTGCRVAYVSVSAEAVRKRISGTSRPLLSEGIDSWQAIMNSRREIYERLATHSVDSSDRTAISVAHELAEWIQQEEEK